MVIKALSAAGRGEISRQIGCSQSAVASVCKTSHLDVRNVAANKLTPSGTTNWRNWCARTDFITAGRLLSSGMLMVYLHHDQ